MLHRFGKALFWLASITSALCAVVVMAAWYNDAPNAIEAYVLGGGYILIAMTAAVFVRYVFGWSHADG